LENYNRRIREVLGPYCSKIGISVIPWPLFLSFIIHEEDFYRNMLIKLDNQDLPKAHKEKNNGNYNININNSISWFKNTERSCRYDSFFFLYSILN